MADCVNLDALSESFDKHLYSQSPEAMQEIKVLVEKHSNTNIFVRAEGWSLLYWVCMRGHEEAVNFLLSHRANPNGDCGGRSQSAVLGAARSGNSAILKKLLDHGAAVNVQDCQGDTPILLAVNGGSLEMTRLLLQHNADPALTNCANVSALTTRMKRADAQAFQEIFSEFGFATDFKIFEKSGADEFAEWVAKRRTHPDSLS
jgi:uncharacterized protein